MTTQAEYERYVRQSRVHLRGALRAASGSAAITVIFVMLGWPWQIPAVVMGVFLLGAGSEVFNVYHNRKKAAKAAAAKRP